MNLPVKTEQVIAKREAWANVGEVIHNTELELQAEKEKIKLSISEPKSIEQINETETKLAEAKRQATALMENRKGVTNNLNAVVERLMKPEKEIREHFTIVESSLLGLKQQKKASDDLIKAKADELKRVREEYIKHVNQFDASAKATILNQCTFAFEYALGKGAITEETYPNYFKAVKDKFKETDFAITAPVIKLNVVTQTEAYLIWSEVSLTVQPPKFYLDLYALQITDKFQFFTISLKNKEGALKNAAMKDAKNATELAKEASQKNVAATLASVSVTVASVATEKTKALKQVYVLDMEVTDQNALTIMAAFAGNFDNARQHVKVTSIFSLSINQMATALVSIKNKDEKFECTGVNFKTIEKL